MLEEQSAGSVTIRHAAWNSTIPAGGTIDLGFVGTWLAGNRAPSAVTLNSAPCLNW